METNSFAASFTRHTVKPAPTRPSAFHPTHDIPLVAVAELTKRPRAASGVFSGQPGNGNFGFANIEAGYGPAYDCDSVVLRGNNGTATEETRYLFFKKSVKF